MTPQAIYETEDQIPEALRGTGLYEERNGRWHIITIGGLKTDADVSRVQTALNNEKAAHQKTKDKYLKFGDMDYDQTMAQLDRIAELEAIAKEKGLDDDKIEEMANSRAQLKITQATAPLERKIEQLGNDLMDRDNTISSYVTKERTRTIHDNIRAAIAKSTGFQQTATEDALFLGERVFEITESGEMMTKDNVGITPGLGPDAWLSEQQATRPHWWGTSSGGGANGGGSGPGGSDNPWKTGNLTDQAKYMKEHGRDKAEQMARAAGSELAY